MESVLIRTCTVDGCDAKYHSKGYCRKHYARWKTYGDPLGAKYIDRGTFEVCTVEGCNRQYSAKGYCKKHYKRWVKSGDPLTTKFNEVCSVDGCNRRHDAKSYCDTHYRRWKKHGDPLFIYVDSNRIDTCTVEGCDGRHQGKGYCNKHYRRWKKHGDPLVIYNDRYIAMCTVEGCGAKHVSKGYCVKHYARWRTHGDPLYRFGRTCTVEGCGAKHMSKGYCQKHYNRWWRNGDPLKLFGKTEAVYKRMQIVKDIFNCFVTKKFPYSNPAKDEVTEIITDIITDFIPRDIKFLSMPHFGRELYLMNEIIGIDNEQSMGVERSGLFSQIKKAMAKLFPGMNIVRGNINEIIMENKIEQEVAHLDYNGSLIESNWRAIDHALDIIPLVFFTVNEGASRDQHLRLPYKSGNPPITGRQVLYQPYTGKGTGKRKTKMACYGYTRIL